MSSSVAPCPDWEVEARKLRHEEKEARARLKSILARRRTCMRQLLEQDVKLVTIAQMFGLSSPGVYNFVNRGLQQEKRQKQQESSLVLS